MHHIEETLRRLKLNMFVAATFRVGLVDFQHNRIHPLGVLRFLKFRTLNWKALHSLPFPFLPAKLILHFFRGASGYHQEKRSTKASFSVFHEPHNNSLVPVHWLLLAAPCSDLSLHVSSHQRHAFYKQAQGFIRSVLQDKPYFVIIWRAILDSCSHHGSERFLIQSLQPVQGIDFFNVCLLLEPSLPSKPASDNLRYVFTHISNQLSVCPVIFTTPIPSHRFLLVRRGSSVATSFLVLLLCALRTVCEAWSPPWALLLCAARKVSLTAVLFISSSRRPSPARQNQLHLPLWCLDAHRRTGCILFRAAQATRWKRCGSFHLQN